MAGDRPLAALVSGFESDPEGSRTALRNFLERDRGSFYASALDVLRKGCGSGGARCLVSLLAGHNLLLQALCDPALTRDQAIALARAGLQVDSMVDVDIARAVANDATDEGIPDSASLARIVDILSELSGCARLFPSLARMVRHTDERLRSRPVPMMGRESRSIPWLQRCLAAANPRTRADAVEAFWGVDSDAVRALLQKAAGDINNRVAGNAVLGLYRIGDPVAIPRLLELAGRPSTLFRTTAAWVMGQTGDPRFTEALARMLGDTDGLVRKRAFDSLGKIRSAASRAHAASEWRVGGSVHPRGDGLRRLELEVVSPRGGQPGISPLQIVVSEDGLNVADYGVEARPKSAPLAMAFVFPSSAAAQSAACNRRMLQLLPWKRRPDLWCAIPYLAPGERGGARVSLAKAGVQFTSDPAQARNFFEEGSARIYYPDVWSSMRRCLDAEVHAPPRRLIVLNCIDQSEPPDFDRLADGAVKRGAAIHAISAVENGALEQLCSSTHGSFRRLQGDEDPGAGVEAAYWTLLARYVVTYRPTSPQPVPVRVRIFSPSGWAETLIA
jgi:hypothetical protein